MGTRPRLAVDIFEAVTVNGRYEKDLLNDYLVRYSRAEIEAALAWLLERGHLRKCGSPLMPLYARPERPVRYTNIRPIHGEDVLLQMHSNFATEKPR